MGFKAGVTVDGMQGAMAYRAALVSPIHGCSHSLTAAAVVRV